MPQKNLLPQIIKNIPKKLKKIQNLTNLNKIKIQKQKLKSIKERKVLFNRHSHQNQVHLRMTKVRKFRSYKFLKKMTNKMKILKRIRKTLNHNQKKNKSQVSFKEYGVQLAGSLLKFQNVYTLYNLIFNIDFKNIYISLT